MYSTNRRTNAQSSDERYSSTSKGSNCNEEESHSILLVNEHLRMLRNEIYGFIPSASSCLESPGSLWGLAERVTAVESAMSILRVLIHMYVPPMSKTVKETVGVDSSVGRFPFLRLSATELSFVVKSMQERESVRFSVCLIHCHSSNEVLRGLRFVGCLWNVVPLNDNRLSWSCVTSSITKQLRICLI